MTQRKNTSAKSAKHAGSAPDRAIALVGLMGAGKSTVGRRLAETLKLPFYDADAEIEKAAGRSVSDIFEELGEDAFRDGEKRVIARLLDGPPHVMATGGGAFVNEGIRTMLKERAVTIWLHADLDLLMSRVMRRNTRPLLQKGDPRKTMARLIEERYPIYSQADLTVDSGPGPHSRTVRAILDALEVFQPPRPGDAS